MSGKIETLGVFGSGTMGTGFAINAIVNGLTVRLFDTSCESIERANDVTALVRAERAQRSFVQTLTKLLRNSVRAWRFSIVIGI